MKDKTKGRYPLAIPTAVKGLAEDAAKQNRRSLNAELGLLIEEGFKWREAQKNQDIA